MAKQRGFTLIEAVITVLLISSSFLAFGLASGQDRQAQEITRQKETAWRVVLSHEATLRSLRFKDLAERAIQIPVPELPGGQLTVTLRRLPALSAFESAFKLSWQSPRGALAISHASIHSPLRSSDAKTE